MLPNHFLLSIELLPDHHVFSCIRKQHLIPEVPGICTRVSLCSISVGQLICLQNVDPDLRRAQANPAPHAGDGFGSASAGLAVAGGLAGQVAWKWWSYRPSDVVPEAPAALAVFARQGSASFYEELEYGAKPTLLGTLFGIGLSVWAYGRIFAGHSRVHAVMESQTFVSVNSVEQTDGAGGEPDKRSVQKSGAGGLGSSE